MQGGKYPYVYVDGIYLRRNWGGEYENVAILVAIAVNEDGYREVLGAAEGNPDFSMARTAFDEYEKIPEPRPEEDVYVDGLIETVEEQIDSIKESLGIEPDAKVEITQDENGDTEIKADGEVVASETEETKEEGETTEEGTEAPAEEGEQGELDFDGDEEEEDDPEEIKKLEEELAKAM